MRFSPLSSQNQQVGSPKTLLGYLQVAALALAFALPVASGGQAAPLRALVANGKTVDIAVVGDSLANDLGRGMEALFRGKPNVNVIKQTQFSTGLARKDYFNWNAKLSTFLRRTNTDAIVVLIGGNDSQAIRVEGRSLDRFSRPWLAEYERRVAHFMRILQRERTRVYWVGLPMVRSATMSRNFHAMNRIFRRQAARHRITYVSIWRDFADARGGYTSFGRSVRGVKRQLRKGDGMHFTEHGTLRLATRVAHAIGVR